MNPNLLARLSRRYLALDIHKHYSIAAGVNFEGEVLLEPLRAKPKVANSAVRPFKSKVSGCT